MDSYLIGYCTGNPLLLSPIGCCSRGQVAYFMLSIDFIARFRYIRAPFISLSCDAVDASSI